MAQSIDTKKEEFRSYLERSAVIDALTKVLVSLYEENHKPQNPIDFIKKSLGGPSAAEYERLERENAELKATIAGLQAELAALQHGAE